MFKGLKSLFIVEEEEGAKSAEQKTADAPANEERPAATATRPGQVSQKFSDILFQAMEQNNLEGFDYLEYKRSLLSLSKMPMDEPTRFQSAFAMAQTMGVSVPKLVESAQHYLKILENEEQKFETALSNQEKNKIESKELEIKQLDKAIQEKAEQIKKLTAEIQAHQQRVGALKNEIYESSSKMEKTKADFLASYNSLIAQIQSDITKMKEFLK